MALESSEVAFQASFSNRGGDAGSWVFHSLVRQVRSGTLLFPLAHTPPNAVTRYQAVPWSTLVNGPPRLDILPVSEKLESVCGVTCLGGRQAGAFSLVGHKWCVLTLISGGRCGLPSTQVWGLSLGP